MKLISVFIPCYNEESVLLELFDRLFAVADSLSGYDFEFVVSDNKSTDASRAILEELAMKDRRVKLIFNMRNFGPGRSGAHGFFQTSGDATICMAADLQDPPELIPSFISKWEQGSKVVLGRNPSSDEKGSMRLLRSLYYKLLARFSEHDEYEHVSGFGLYDKEVVGILRQECNPSPNFRISLSEYGYPVSFVDYVKPQRAGGHSSYSIGRYIDLTVDSYVSLSEKPLYFIIRAGAAASAFFLFAAIVLVVTAIALGSFDVLLASIGMLICTGCSLTVMVVGVGALYSAITLNWMKRKPLVVEEKRINFQKNDEFH